MRLGTSSGQERVSHVQSSGVVLIPNDEELHNLDHNNSIGVICDNSYRLARNSDHVTHHEMQINDDQEEIISEDNEACEDDNNDAEDADTNKYQ